MRVMLTNDEAKLVVSIIGAHLHRRISIDIKNANLPGQTDTEVTLESLISVIAETVDVTPSWVSRRLEEYGAF